MFRINFNLIQWKISNFMRLRIHILTMLIFSSEGGASKMHYLKVFEVQL